MSKKNIFLIMILCLVGVVFVFLINRHSGKTRASVNIGMFQEVDSKALAVQNGQPNSLNNLVDAIFADFDVSQLDPNLIASLKDRIIRAEQSGHVVQEYQIVQGVNWLATQFTAPDYARTSSLQTRDTREKLGKYLPNFFIDKDAQGNVRSSRLVNGELSGSVTSTQGVYLFLTIVQQKMINEKFLKEPSQWDADFYAAQQSGTAEEDSSTNTQPSFEGKYSQKINEIHQVVTNSNLMNNQSEIERLSQGALDQLGIPR